MGVLSERGFVREGFCPRGFILGFFVLGVFVLEGVCPTLHLATVSTFSAYAIYVSVTHARTSKKLLALTPNTNPSANRLIKLSWWVDGIAFVYECGNRGLHRLCTILTSNNCGISFSAK